MAHWGRTPANTKVGGAEFVANFTGIESWRLITGRTPGITCAQLRQWLVEGMAAATEVDASGGAAHQQGRAQRVGELLGADVVEEQQAVQQQRADSAVVRVHSVLPHAGGVDHAVAEPNPEDGG